MYDTDGDGCLTRDQLAEYLKTTLQMVESINEAWPFGFSKAAIKDAVDDCCRVRVSLSPRGVSFDRSAANPPFSNWRLTPQSQYVSGL